MEYDISIYNIYDNASKVISSSKGGCDIGNCSEPKAANAAHQNSSPITGYDTIWRGNGENPHSFTGENVGNFVSGNYGQMNPCNTCANPHNIREYMDYANSNDK